MTESSAPSGAFGDVPPTARGHIALLFHEAVHRLVYLARARALAAGQSLDTVFEEFPFVQAYFASARARMPDDLTWEASLHWFLTENSRWVADAAGHLPLRALRDELGLDHAALVAIALAGLVEEEARFMAFYARLQAPREHRRPTVGLLVELLDDDPANGTATAACRALLDAGVLDTGDTDAPRAEWEVRVPVAVWNAVTGEVPDGPVPGVHYHDATAFPRIADLIAAPAVAETLAALPALLATGGAHAVIVRASPGSERLDALGAVARALGRGVLDIDGMPAAGDPRLRVIGPLCTLLRAMPVFTADPGPGESCQPGPLPGYRGPCGFVLGHEGGIAGDAAARAVCVVIPPDDAGLRRRHWQRALDGRPVHDLDEIVQRFALPGGHIRQCARLAAAHAALAGRHAVSADDVRLATRAINRQQLDSLAARLDDAGGWSRLVVSPTTFHELTALEQRCRHREQLAQLLASDIPGGMNRGVRALFEGPSGTGKTLAARVLATELGRDLYRVDLAAVVNKYIGETEKNLSRILARAEDLDVVLLLDEGDALMSRRTDVKSSTDRYANLETNYLLQRLDTYTGIVIVTTNAGGSIDAAFRRRIDAVVRFAVPDAEQRWHLWLGHLPRDHAVGAGAMERIAIRHALTGGQIRTAAVDATLRALARADSRVTESDVEAALHAEYRKAGAAFPMPATRADRHADDALDAFLGAIS